METHFCVSKPCSPSNVQPMTAAIWSTPPDKCNLDFPARTLLRFMHNHHLLQLTGKPLWLTILGGSHTYVNKILDTNKLPLSQQHLSTPVTSVRSIPSSEHNGDGGVALTSLDKASGKERTEVFDAVIMATHSDTTLKILGDGATEAEKEILGSFGWNRNEAILHCDEEVRKCYHYYIRRLQATDLANVHKLMPVDRSAWSCWNYLTASEVGANGVKRSNVDQVAL